MCVFLRPFFVFVNLDLKLASVLTIKVFKEISTRFNDIRARTVWKKSLLVARLSFLFVGGPTYIFTLVYTVRTVICVQGFLAPAGQAGLNAQCAIRPVVGIPAVAQVAARFAYVAMRCFTG